MNPDILKERRQGTFNPDDVTEHLYGKNVMHHRRLAISRAAQDPDFKVAENFSTMPRDDQYSESVRMFTIMMKKAKDYGYMQDRESSVDALRAYAEAVFIGPHPFSLHTSMFKSAIESQGTDEQKQKWLPLVASYKIIGTYAQTEMGHGTFLRGLETTATYDRDKEEFVINSPTITSTKYWPGGLGKTKNYAIVMAQLIIDGKSYGMHAFMVQLRDLNTHEPLPGKVQKPSVDSYLWFFMHSIDVVGIEIGDINCKFGYETVDNGFLRLSNIRIPRTNMLMRYSQVAPDGSYKRQALPQITYLTMVYIRMALVNGAALELSKAVTIATRYSAVRRQTANSKGIEPQILDYQTQQMKLFPSIATAYAFYFTGSGLQAIYNEINDSIKLGDTSRLPEIHCLTACLKPYSTEISNLNIEICRQACGGHGYSHSSGIPKIIMRWTPSCTYEGENTVLYLQGARSLLKFRRMAQTSRSLPPIVQFLHERAIVPETLKATMVFEDLEIYKTIFKLNVLLMIDNVVKRMQDEDNTSADATWNSNSVYLVQTAKANAIYLSVCMFIDALKRPEWEPNALSVMKKVCEFYVVDTIITNSGSFLQNQILSSSQMEVMSVRRLELLKILRPNAVTLVDAFDHPDRLLNSCLGRYDGNVYEALYEYAKNSSLNKQQVHPSFYKYVKPMQNAMNSKL